LENKTPKTKTDHRGFSLNVRDDQDDNCKVVLETLLRSSLRQETVNNARDSREERVERKLERKEAGYGSSAVE
jgi:hypothetical protein